MAPIRIKHVVSFSSQDPRHPVDNLLSEDHPRPWLSCPRDRARQLKVELQLERACRIAFIDIGNSGSAFLQADVGSSSWPVDQPFVTLLPSATLMSPADARQGKGGTGVRMFKEGDFLKEAANEKWDRLRLTCSQPFNKQAQFGLSFIRVRSPADEDDHARTAVATPHQEAKLSSLPHIPAEQMKNEDETDLRNQAQETFKEKLQQVLSSCSPRSPHLSRTARMVLAAKSRKRIRPVTAPSSPPIPLDTKKRDCQSEDSTVSSDYFPVDQLPGHASSCGETDAIVVSSSDDDSSVGSWLGPAAPAESWVSCPLCSFRFPSSEVARHASTCGE
ncbi:protein XNDC1N [Gastrophryne carolinensis]